MSKLGEVKKGKEIGKKGGSATSYFMWAECLDCGKQRWVICFKKQPRNKRCKMCGGKYAAKKLPTRYGVKNPAWKGGRVFLAGYIGIRKTGHPRSNNGYVLEHILVWEATHKKSLPKGWVIHHLNGVKSDNRSCNLVGLPRKKHHVELVNQALKTRIRKLEKQLMYG